MFNTIQNFKNLETLKVDAYRSSAWHDRYIHPKDFLKLKNLPKLTTLKLSNAIIEDERFYPTNSILNQFKHLKHLKKLDLSNNDISFTGLGLLIKNPSFKNHLEELNLQGNETREPHGTPFQSFSGERKEKGLKNAVNHFKKLRFLNGKIFQPIKKESFIPMFMQKFWKVLKYLYPYRKEE